MVLFCYCFGCTKIDARAQGKVAMGKKRRKKKKCFRKSGILKVCFEGAFIIMAALITVCGPMAHQLWDPEEPTNTTRSVAKTEPVKPDSARPHSGDRRSHTVAGSSHLPHALPGDFKAGFGRVDDWFVDQYDPSADTMRLSFSGLRVRSRNPDIGWVDGVLTSLDLARGTLHSTGDSHIVSIDNPHVVAGLIVELGAVAPGQVAIFDLDLADTLEVVENESSSTATIKIERARLNHGLSTVQMPDLVPVPDEIVLQSRTSIVGALRNCQFILDGDRTEALLMAKL